MAKKQPPKKPAAKSSRKRPAAGAEPPAAASAAPSRPPKGSPHELLAHLLTQAKQGEPGAIDMAIELLSSWPTKVLDNPTERLEKARVRSRTSRKGRATKCTPAITALYVAHLREGLGFDTTSKACGIGVATAREWRARGERGEEPYAAFFRACEEASGSAVIEAHNKVMEAIRNGDLDTAAKWAGWMLERKAPGEYGKRQDLRLEGADGGPVQLDVSGALVVGGFTPEQLAAMSDEELDQELEKIDEAAG